MNDNDYIEELAQVIHDTWLPINQGTVTVGETRICIEDALKIAENLYYNGYCKRPHGEWKSDIEYYDDDYSECNTRKIWSCSICGRTERTKQPYCNCGAEMDKE